MSELKKPAHFPVSNWSLGNSQAPAADEPPAATAPKGEKLQKVLARLGLGSRREIETWISAGRVQVNGRPAGLARRVELGDAITVDGRPVRQQDAQLVRRVLIYNKPLGEVCSRSDPEGRPSVFESLPRLRTGRWINVGRLDITTTGLLMFTTDGELANRLMHPSYQMDREYAVRVRGEVDDDMIARLKAGVMLDDGMARFTDLQKAPGGEGLNHWYHCVVMEGRNREVRRLWESQGLVVSRLKRVRFGPVFLNADLSMGRWREMTQAEVDILSEEVGLKPVLLPELKARVRERQERQQRKAGSSAGKSRRPAPVKKPTAATVPERASAARGQSAGAGQTRAGANKAKVRVGRRPELPSEGRRPGFRRGPRP